MRAKLFKIPDFKKSLHKKAAGHFFKALDYSHPYILSGHTKDGAPFCVANYGNDEELVGLIEHVKFLILTSEREDI